LLRGPRIATLFPYTTLFRSRGRGGLEDERERTVLVDGDLDGDDVAALVCGGVVVRLAELHDVDAVLTQRRPDGRCGVGGAGLDLDRKSTRLNSSHVKISYAV